MGQTAHAQDALATTEATLRARVASGARGAAAITTVVGLVGRCVEGDVITLYAVRDEDGEVVVEM